MSRIFGVTLALLAAVLLLTTIVRSTENQLPNDRVGTYQATVGTALNGNVKTPVLVILDTRTGKAKIMAPFNTGFGANQRWITVDGR